MRDYIIEGKINDPECKANTIKAITDRTCRNNCKHWGYSQKKGKRTCLLGYRK